MMKLSKRDIDYLIKVAHKAGEAIMKFYHEDEDNIARKADNSPVTAADLASNEIVTQALQSRFPEISIVSEENDEAYNVKILSKAKVFWLIDPLDGTWSFIHRKGDFVINIALINHGVPVWGLIYSPLNHDCYFLGGDGKCYIKNLSKKPLQSNLIKPKERFNGGIDFLVSQQTLDQRTQDFIDKYPLKTITPIASAIKFGLMVKGIGDIYPRFKRTCIWDTGAGHALLNACGGGIYDFSLKPLSYNSTNIYNPDFIAVVKNALLEKI